MRSTLKIAGSVLLAGLVFAACTQHAWEDYWITFRCSRNLATGHGLVYTPGERLHSFTSPLGVLLPAAFSWLTGNQSDNLVLWLFRVTSLGALAAGMVLFFRMLQSLQLRPASCWLTVALIGLDAKLVDFSINGMETGLLIFFLALAIHGLIVAGPRQTLRIGVGWAGLMWTRPDSCVYIAILGLGAMLFLPGKTGGKSRVEWAKLLFSAGLVCAVLYAGWFVWSWRYYGTPVPQTVTAKAASLSPIALFDFVAALAMFPVRLLAPFDMVLPLTFLPAYAEYGGWPAFLVFVSYVLGLPAALAWLIPGVRPQTRLFSLAYFLGGFFLIAVIRKPFPWYLPAVAVFGYLTLGFIFDQALCLATRCSRPRGAGGPYDHRLAMLWILGIGVVVGQAAVTVCVARQMRVQQRFIENGLRRPIGLWLRAHARTPHDTVMLEPLGYIGYYSGLKMLDWTGLASKEIVEARKRSGPSGPDAITLKLMPDWLVLRPMEVQYGLFLEPASLQKFYDLVQEFDVSDKISATRWLPGRFYLQFDQTYLVFHRKPDVTAQSPDSGPGQ